jgi:Concanavalin A-like lectin/glucanases superfamily
MPPVYPAGSYPAKVVADGAVAYWRLGETSGTTAVDVIGGANGTISGGVTLGQPGALADGNTAMVFDGTTGYISVPSSAAITPIGPFTVEAWIKTTKFGYCPIVDKIGSPGFAGFLFDVGATTPGLVCLWTGAAWVSGVRDVENGQWHHVVAVWNGTVVAIYVDGVLDTSQTPTSTLLTATTHALEIGRRYDAPHFAQGTIDDVAFYATALTPTQIAAHYQARLIGLYPTGSYPDKVIRDGAVAYWRLGETSGTTAVDVIGGFNGTISGGVTLNQPGALADGDKAMLFDGTTGSVNMGTVVPLQITGDLTVEAWVYKTATALGMVAVCQQSSGAVIPYEFRLTAVNPAGIELVHAGDGGGEVVASTGTVANNSWHHVVVTRAGPAVTFYIDGILSNSTTGTITPTGTGAVTSIGRRTDTFGFFPGSLDDVAIYPTALTAPQIAAHYAARTWTAFGPTIADLRYRWCRFTRPRFRQVTR